jgi:hypothetical protein
MNATLSPPRRGFLVARTEGLDRTTCDQAPRIDMISMGSNLMMAEAPHIGVPKQKLPHVTLSPRKAPGKSFSSVDKPKAPSPSSRNSFKEKCTMKALSLLQLPSSNTDAGSDADSSASTERSSEPASPLSQQDEELEPPFDRRKRRVSFQRDCHARITGKPMPTRKKELTLYEIKQTWWTRTELRKCRERAQETCRELLDTQIDYKLAMVRILRRCGAEHKPDIEAYRYYHQIFDDQKNGSSATLSMIKEERDLRRVIENVDTARGLEKRLLNAMDVPFHRHKRSVVGVMETQARMREKECTFGETEQEIAARYRKHCQYAATWASIIAECDATAAGNRAMI